MGLWDVRDHPCCRCAKVVDVNGTPGPLTEPAEQTPVERAVETCREIIRDGISDVLAVRAGRSPRQPSHQGTDYDAGYAQGRKDAARVVLLALGEKGVGDTSATIPFKDTE